MKIFLSHRSRDKALVREFKSCLPSFLDAWLDEESLTWGEAFAAELKSTIQDDADFLVAFLDAEALKSAWVRQELEWAHARERELGRPFLLPILIDQAAADALPPDLAGRLYLRLTDYTRLSVEALAHKATLQLFQLITECYARLRPKSTDPGSLLEARDALSAGQAKLLGYLEREGNGREATQRQIEQACGYTAASAELFYRLETLLSQGFLVKRRIAAEGQFTYRLSDAFQHQLARV